MSITALIHLEREYETEAKLLYPEDGDVYLQIDLDPNSTLFVHSNITPKAFVDFCDMFGLTVGEVEHAN